MRIVTLVSLIASLTLIPQACRNEGPSTRAASHADNIATDLPDDGGDLVNSLYWTNNGNIFRGRCVDATEFNRNQCSSELVSMPYEAFKGELDGGLSATIRDLTAEARQIQDAIALIERDLADARAELDALERQTGGLDAELTKLRNDIKNYEVNLAEYREQLAMIEQALQNAVDQEIAAMRPIVMARIQDWQSRISQVSAQIEHVLAQFAGLRTQITEISTRVTSLSARSQNLQIELAGVNQRLELAYGDFSVYTETLRRLNMGITYTVWSTNSLLLRERLFIRRFDTIFKRHT